MLGGLIEGLEGRYEVWRSDLKWGGVGLKPGRLIAAWRAKLRAKMRAGRSNMSS